MKKNQVRALVVKSNVRAGGIVIGSIVDGKKSIVIGSKLAPIVIGS